jgi:hypothetical protein
VRGGNPKCRLYARRVGPGAQEDKQDVALRTGGVVEYAERAYSCLCNGGRRLLVKARRPLGTSMLVVDRLWMCTRLIAHFVSCVFRAARWQALL